MYIHCTFLYLSSLSECLLKFHCLFLTDSIYLNKHLLLPLFSYFSIYIIYRYFIIITIIIFITVLIILTIVNLFTIFIIIIIIFTTINTFITTTTISIYCIIMITNMCLYPSWLPTIPSANAWCSTCEVYTIGHATFICFVVVVVVLGLFCFGLCLLICLGRLGCHFSTFLIFLDYCYTL